jgi:hypothetical protein
MREQLKLLLAAKPWRNCFRISAYPKKQRSEPSAMVDSRGSGSIPRLQISQTEFEDNWPKLGE